MTAYPKSIRIKVEPRYRRPHRFEPPHDDPAPGPCWYCLKPRSAKVHQPRKPIRAKRWGVSRSARGTKHRRRARDFDRMAALSEKDCAVWNWFLSLPLARIKTLIAEGFDGCAGRIEVAHLSLGKTAGRRRAPDSQTAPICTSRHRQPGIDGGVGGKAPWYVALGYDGQQELRRWLIDWADAQLAAARH